VQFDFHVPPDISELIAAAENPATVAFSVRSWLSADHAVRAGADRLLGGGHGDRLAGNTDDAALDRIHRGQWLSLWDHRRTVPVWRRLKSLLGVTLRSRLPQLAAWRISRMQYFQSRASLLGFMPQHKREALALRRRLHACLLGCAETNDDFGASLDQFLDHLAPYETGVLWNSARASGIPFRQPFADAWVARSAASLHLDERERDGRNRAAFRQAMHDTLPTSILERRTKTNFARPWCAAWAEMRQKLDGPAALRPIQEILEISGDLRDRLQTMGQSGPGSKLATDLYACSAWISLHSG
jgi:hypothetical protein